MWSHIYDESNTSTEEVTPDSCESSELAVLGVELTDSSCKAVLNGSETHGSRRAVVTVKSDSFDADVLFRVWYTGEISVSR